MPSSDDPVVVSATTQEWGGLRWWLCGRYFQRKGRRLHRAVYEAANGPVPDGYHVHHVNEDRTDNRLANLVLREAGDHLAEHSRNPTPAQRAARARNARTFAAAGNARLTTAARRAAATFAEPIACECPICGASFTLKPATYRDRVKRRGGAPPTCSRSCGGQAGRTVTVASLTPG